MSRRPLVTGAPAGAAVRGRPRSLLPILVPLLLALLAWVAWPYVTLWRMDRALVRGDAVALAPFVDLDSIRAEVRRGLDKDERGTLGPRSERFADWLAKTLKSGGAPALDRAVTLAWVRERMLAESPPGTGLGPALTWAFFRGPFRFVVRLGDPRDEPVLLRLSVGTAGWRVSALTY